MAPVAPTFKMPEGDDARRDALLADLNNALCVARCAAQLAGLETAEFAVRELLLTVLGEIDRAAGVARRLGGGS